MANSELCKENWIIAEDLVKFYNKQDFLVAYNGGENFIYVGFCPSKNFCGCLLSSVFCRALFSSHIGVTRRIRALRKIVLKITFIALRTVSMGNPPYFNWRCNSLCGGIIGIESWAACEVWQFCSVSSIRLTKEIQSGPNMLFGCVGGKGNKTISNQPIISLMTVICARSS